MSELLDRSVSEGKRLGKMSLYFGCWKEAGHFLRDTNGWQVYDSNGKKPSDLPWDEGLMDGTLLRNGKVPGIVTGKVYWTCGGKDAFWYAFYWWDRSVDKRGACNSGIYVRGFDHREPQSAFEYGCSQFPHVIERQKFPLVLQNIPA